jgi:hypothetical protein
LVKANKRPAQNYDIVKQTLPLEGRNGTVTLNTKGYVQWEIIVAIKKKGFRAKFHYSWLHIFGSTT